MKKFKYFQEDYPESKNPDWSLLYGKERELYVLARYADHLIDGDDYRPLEYRDIFSNFKSAEDTIKNLMKSHGIYKEFKMLYREDHESFIRYVAIRSEADYALTKQYLEFIIFIERLNNTPCDF